MKCESGFRSIRTGIIITQSGVHHYLRSLEPISWEVLWQLCLGAGRGNDPVYHNISILWLYTFNEPCQMYICLCRLYLRVESMMAWYAWQPMIMVQSGSTIVLFPSFSVTARPRRGVGERKWLQQIYFITPHYFYPRQKLTIKKLTNIQTFRKKKKKRQE